MTRIKPSLLLALPVLLAGCALAVPPDKADYIGEWEGETAYLIITPGSFVRYEQHQGRFLGRAVEGSLRGFKGDNFAIGFGPFATTIIVNKPPYMDGDDWKMVVDGKELIRID